MKEHDKDDSLPSLALGHFIMKVQNIDESYRFYTGLGLRASGCYDSVALVELRGGTHLLLFQKDDPRVVDIPNSQNGQRLDFSGEKLDLMIAGSTKEDLASFRASLIGKGYSPSAIADEQLYGHHYFSIRDPDGTGITFYSSHCSDKPV